MNGSSPIASENQHLAQLLQNQFISEVWKTIKEQKRQIISEHLFNQPGRFDEAIFSIVKPTNVLFNLAQQTMAGRSVSPTVRDMLADEDIRRFMDAIVIMSENSSETRQANRIIDNHPESVSNSTLQHTENQDVEQPSSSQSKAEPVVPILDIPAPDPIEITKVNAASATILPPAGPKSHESPFYAHLNSSQIALLCDIILDTEKFEQANFEMRRLQANSTDDLSLKEPFVELSGDERKKIRRIVTEPAMQKALLRLRDEFDTACHQGSEAMFALPQPFPSLQPSDREALRPLIQSPEHRAYTVYCQQRREAMLTAQPLPSEISTRLSGKEKKAIRKQLRDRRALAYVGSLMAGSTGQVSPM